MPQTIVELADKELLQTGTPGISFQIVDNEATGGMTGVGHMEAGALMPKHWHMHADETVYILSGDVVSEGRSYGSGTFFSIPAGATHGPMTTEHGCSMLFRYSAELDMQMDAPDVSA